MTTKVDNSNTTQNPVGRFMVAVGAVIASPDGKILLIKRSEKLDWHPGEWESMYGRIAQHEDPKDGLTRELKEELGISVAVGRLLTCWHIYRGHEETAENELVGITFLATTNQIEIKLSDEHEEYRWVTPEEAKELIKVEGIHRDIQAYIDLQGQALQVQHLIVPRYSRDKYEGRHVKMKELWGDKLTFLSDNQAITVNGDKIEIVTKQRR